MKNLYKLRAVPLPNAAYQARCDKVGARNTWMVIIKVKWQTIAHRIAILSIAKNGEWIEYLDTDIGLRE